MLLAQTCRMTIGRPTSRPMTHQMLALLRHTLRLRLLLRLPLQRLLLLCLLLSLHVRRRHRLPLLLLLTCRRRLLLLRHRRLHDVHQVRMMISAASGARFERRAGPWLLQEGCLILNMLRGRVWVTGHCRHRRRRPCMAQTTPVSPIAGTATPASHDAAQDLPSLFEARTGAKPGTTVCVSCVAAQQAVQEHEGRRPLRSQGGVMRGMIWAAAMA